jgi:hypothetical protein
MTKFEITDEIMTQAIHAAIKETGLIDIISNLDVELKSAKEENARLREALIWIEDCCTITSASEYVNIIESCRDVAQRELRKGKS